MTTTLNSDQQYLLHFDIHRGRTVWVPISDHIADNLKEIKSFYTISTETLDYPIAVYNNHQKFMLEEANVEPEEIWI